MMAEIRRVALFVFDRDNDYQALLEQDSEDSARRHRLELAVFHAENSLPKQVEQIRGALVGSTMRAPDAILVSPVSEVALMPMVHVAARARIAWVFLNRWNDAINDLRGEYPGVPIFTVSADQDQVGTVHGRQIARLWRPGDECVYIQGPLGTSSAKRRLAGTERELAGSATTLTILHGDWSRQGGRDVMSQWLRMLPRASMANLVVVAQNDSMAIGAREALLEWNVGHRATLQADIVGCDGSPEFGQAMVVTRQISATVVIPSVSGRAIDQLVASERAGHLPTAEIRVPVESYPSVEAIRSLRTEHSTSPAP
jgi:ABC-type sugar transport system substrate-binding protein